MSSEAEKSLGGRNRWRLAGWGAAVLLLATPFFAMQVTDEVNWGAGDFLFAAVMFGLVGLLLEWAVRASGNWFYRVGVAAAVGGGFMLIWANLAVGILGDEDNAANLLFFAVPAIGIAGAALTRCRERGMAWAMLSAGLALLAVPVVAYSFQIGDAVRLDRFAYPFFLLVPALPWFIAAALFRRAEKA